MGKKTIQERDQREYCGAPLSSCLDCYERDVIMYMGAAQGKMSVRMVEKGEY